MSPLRVSRGNPLPETREGDQVGPQRADPVLRLPEPAPLHAHARVEGVMPGEADQMRRVRVAERLQHPRTPEERAPLRAPWAELRLRGERDVGLRPAGEEEDADGAEVPVVEGAEIGVQAGRPRGDDRCAVAVDREDQVEVGPRVRVARGVGAGEGGSRDRGVLAGEAQETVRDLVLVHGCRFCVRLSTGIALTSRFRGVPTSCPSRQVPAALSTSSAWAPSAA